MGRKHPKLPLSLGFRHPAGGGPSHGHRQHAQKNLVKIAHVALEICSRTDRHTDTQTCSSQYFATAITGEVITIMIIRITLVWDFQTEISGIFRAVFRGQMPFRCPDHKNREWNRKATILQCSQRYL